jgi:cytochrome c554/c'-like protein
MLRHVVWAAVVVTMFAGAFVLAPQTAAPPAAPQAEAQAGPKYTGTASCGASNCHGSTKPKADYPKLNENIVWQQKERHAKAYETLTNEKLKSGVRPSAIAKKLNIAKAETSDRCLVCHAVNVKPELRGPKFDITDGVHCDGCHGPGEKWLEPHANKGWTHEQSVKLGMYDTKNLLMRADKCVSCHLQIDADMVAAGHPDLLAFELDTFSLQMPPHWRDKGTWFGARAWATGQVVSLREAAKQVADRAKANATPKLMQDAAAKVRGHGAVVRHVFAAMAPDAQKSLETDVAAVADLVAKGDRAGAGAAASRLVATTNAQAPKIAARELDQASTLKMLQAVAGDADGVCAGIRGAEQGAMAMDRLYSTYSKAPGNKADKAAGDALDRLFGLLEDPAKFDAGKCATAVKAFQAAVK